MYLYCFWKAKPKAILAFQSQKTLAKQNLSHKVVLWLFSFKNRILSNLIMLIIEFHVQRLKSGLRKIKEKNVLIFCWTEWIWQMNSPPHFSFSCYSNLKIFGKEDNLYASQKEIRWSSSHLKHSLAWIMMFSTKMAFSNGHCCSAIDTDLIKLQVPWCGFDIKHQIIREIKLN